MPEYRSLPQPDEFKEESELAGTRVAGVYVLFNGLSIAYIGQSRNIQVRLGQHRREGTKKFTTARFYPLDDLESRLALEAILILQLRPAHNRGLRLGLAGGRIWAIQWRAR